jgi:serine/threonine protein kinase
MILALILLPRACVCHLIRLLPEPFVWSLAAQLLLGLDACHRHDPEAAAQGLSWAKRSAPPPWEATAAAVDIAAVHAAAPTTQQPPPVGQHPQQQAGGSDDPTLLRHAILHRDMKPANVLLSQPYIQGCSGGGSGGVVAKIGDFGMAKQVGIGHPAIGPPALS